MKYILRKSRNGSLITILCLCGLVMNIAFADDVLSPKDLLMLKSVTSAKISPDGKWVAYTLRSPRSAMDKAGPAYSELYLVSSISGEIKPYITGKVNISSPKWNPDGSKIAFLMKRGENARSQIWIISATGGEAWQASQSETNVLDYQWHPTEKKVIYIATTAKSGKEKKLADKGYGFIYYQENLKHRNIYLLDLDNSDETNNTKQISSDRTYWNMQISSDGKTLAASGSEKNLIDHRYMFRKIYLIDLKTTTSKQLTDNPGKLGNYAFSPDGSRLVYAAALTREDHQVSQAYVLNLDGNDVKNLTPPDFKGHVSWVGWQDEETVIYRSGEGVWPTLSLIDANGGEREVILHSQKNGVSFGTPAVSASQKIFTFVGSSPETPGEVYIWGQDGKMKKMTNSNPWLEKRVLGKQKVIRYKARDGWEIEGIMIYPVGYKKDSQYPLVVYVHGGPESHYSNSWLSRYSTPGQVLAGKGYVVFYPNYRASTGYGVKFAMAGYEDPAGKEFDDIADGIVHLVDQGIADAGRVGLAGGSYGGYASAWFATYYTKYVKAVCMFVGISDLISKRGTTDIPYEELYVHSGKKLDQMWDLSLKRSPVYWAHQSKTAVLIYGGASDTRVHPSQSIEFYWRLRMNDHPAVRLVQYPGERHGNSKQPGRADVLFRQIDWLDWYVFENIPLDGPMPPLDISEKYGLDLD